MFLLVFWFQIVAIASAALDEYRVESKKMVIALVNMEQAFIPPQHFIRLVQRRCVYVQIALFVFVEATSLFIYAALVDCVVYHV